MLRNKFILLLLVTGIVLFMAGCSPSNDHDWTGSFEKTQKVNVISSDGTDVATISDMKAVQNFVEALKMDEWKIADIPSGAKKGKVFKLYQEETAKLFDKSDNEQKQDNLIEVATLTTYKDVPYIQLSFHTLSMVFEVPEQVAEYLNSES